jgi:sugar/nucleoside kinase (ribokinase family)
MSLFDKKVEYVMDILGIGHAILESHAYVSAEFLSSKALMTDQFLIVAPEVIHNLKKKVTIHHQSAGGPCATVLSILNTMDIHTRLLGKVADDDAGHQFRSLFNGKSFKEDSGPTPLDHTSEKLVLITPDQHRLTLVSYGASWYLACPNDIKITNQTWILIDGSLLDSPYGQNVISQILTTKDHGPIVLIIPDMNVIIRNHSYLTHLIMNHVHIMIGNKEEMQELTGYHTLKECLDVLEGLPVHWSATTLGHKGSIIIHNGHTPVLIKNNDSCFMDHHHEHIGAGEAYAAGFIHALMTGHEDEKEVGYEAHECALKVLENTFLNI